MTLQVCYDSLIQWLYERCRILRKEDEFNVAQLNIFWIKRPAAFKLQFHFNNHSRKIRPVIQAFLLNVYDTVYTPGGI